MNTIPTSSIISGNQIQTDSITTNLTVACDPHLLVPTLSNGVPNPVFDKKKDGIFNIILVALPTFLTYFINRLLYSMCVGSTNQM